MSDANPCSYYGHKWERDLRQSAELPPGYILETCSWCGEDRTVLER